MGSNPNFSSSGNLTGTRAVSGEALSAPTHWIVNALGGLDSPGSWAVAQSGSQQTVYYWPAYLDDDNAPALGDVWLPSLTELVQTKGENVHLSALTFTGGDRYCWGGQDKGGVQHDYAAADARDALVRVRFATNVVD